MGLKGAWSISPAACELPHCRRETIPARCPSERWCSSVPIKQRSSSHPPARGGILGDTPRPPARGAVPAVGGSPRLLLGFRAGHGRGIEAEGARRQGGSNQGECRGNG